MNFFEQQDRAHRNTQRLVGLFILSVCCIIVTIYGVAVISLAIASKGKTPIIPWQPQLFLIVAVATILLIGVGSWFKLLALRQGGQVIAQDLGGRLLIPSTTDPAEQQLLNVVEEMAIASGISVPAVYILDREQGINAFAAGFTPNDAVIGVTRGCLEQLNRDQLQGVIGHEFSHILNGDMGLNLRLVGILHGILLIYLTGRILCDFRSRDRNYSLLIFGLGLIVVGSVGLFCGRLIKSAVSRQREFLADASAVQFTRNPSGIAGALRKIAAHHGSSLVQSPYAEENSHLFFGNALRFNFLGELFATHPPLDQRILRLESNPIQSAAPKPSASTRNRQRPELQDSLVMGLAATGKSPSADAVKIQTVPDQVIAQVGTVTPEQFAHAQALLAKLPASIQAGIRDRHNAIAIVYALALDLENPQVQEKQLDWLRQVEPSEVVESTLGFSQEIAQLDPQIRLPLLDLTIPALRQSSATECQQLFKCVTGLARANKQRSLADFVLYIVLWHRLQPCVNATVENKIQYTALTQVWPDCLILLSALAQVGQTSQNEVAYAFRSGIYRLPGASQQELPETPPVFNLGELHQSLKRLGLVSAKLKQKIVDACAHTVLLDNVVTVQEADLLRAIAITLDCPLPPFLKSSR
jgi:Zn-dependent protease with chaperone function